MTDYEQAANHYLDAEQKLRTAIVHARRRNVSWTAIGRPLGISKQAAQQRFGEMVRQANMVPFIAFDGGPLTDQAVRDDGARDRAQHRHAITTDDYDLRDRETNA